MKQKHLRISLVIPVYNDRKCLEACLTNVSRLKRRPDEVIVVNNNSTDGSDELALNFPFVKLLNEHDQGVIHARNHGFDAASGDIIARIDSDTLLPENWINQIEQLFIQQPNLSAVSGSMTYYDFYLTRLSHWMDRIGRKFLARRMKRRVFLQGANMAIRKNAWKSVRNSVCSSSGIHEDLDLAIHLQEQGFKVSYDEQLRAEISLRRVGHGFREFAAYCLVSPRTYAKHKLWCRVYMYPIILLVWMIYPVAHIVYLSYDSELKSLSLSAFIANRLSEGRVDPSTNIV